MDLNGAPMLGTPKQNSFIIKLASAIGYATLLEAVNFALGLHASTPWRNPFTMGDASQVITNLLEKCKAAGISTFGHGGGRKKGGKRRKSEPAPTPAPAPPSTPPLPGVPKPTTGTLEELFNALPMMQAQIVFERLVTALHLRGGHPAAKLSTECLHAELETRGHGRLEAVATPMLCEELERRGLPASYLLTAPDNVAVAPGAVATLMAMHLDDQLGAYTPFANGYKDKLRTLLLEAGELSE